MFKRKLYGDILKRRKETSHELTKKGKKRGRGRQQQYKKSVGGV